MYYEEQVVNGVLSYRIYPDGPFVAHTPEALTKHIVSLKEDARRAKELFAESKYRESSSEAFARGAQYAAGNSRGWR